MKKAVERSAMAIRAIWKRFISARNDSLEEAWSRVALSVEIDQLFTDNRSSIDDTYDFSDPPVSKQGILSNLIHRLSETAPFKRLSDIRFLGALDYLLIRNPNGAPKNQRYSRAQHSLGVAALAQYYAENSSHSIYGQKLCVATALLHDIGHAPFSHTLEPVLQKHFGLNHHMVSSDIILGKVGTSEVAETLKHFGVNPHEVVELLSTKHDEFDGMFSGPINFDTIEGILRSRSYLKMDQIALSPVRVLVAAMSKSTEKDRDSVDAFWLCKDEIYNLVIRSKTGVLFDALFQQVAEYCISEFDESDFFLTESQSFKKHPGFREVLEQRFWPAIIDKVMPDRLQFETRRFCINDQADFFTAPYAERYKQSKSPSLLTLNNL